MPQAMAAQTLYNCTNGGVRAIVLDSRECETSLIMTSVFIVDDQDSARTGLRLRIGLEDDLTVIGEAADADTALSRIAALRPDVVVMDVAMPGVDGISATTELKARMPAVAVVMLSLHDDPQTREAAAEAGAVAFVCKQEPDGVLLAALRRANASRRSGGASYPP
jgi:DNA-binding NarL/FixJ family response regulator